MMFKKLNIVREWDSPKFKKIFPELKHLSNEEICDRLDSVGIDYYCTKEVKVSGLIRFTLPFALILYFFMFIGLPFVFMLTGKWNYGNIHKSKVYNWFKILKLS